MESDGNRDGAPIVIEASAFRVTDPTGRVVAELTVNTKREPVMMFYSPRGRPRVAIGVSKDGDGRLFMIDDDGFPRINLTFSPTGHCQLAMSGQKDATMVSMSRAADGSAGLVVVDGRGDPRAHIGIDGPGYPFIAAMNPGGEIVWNAVKPQRGATGGIINPQTGKPF